DQPNASSSNQLGCLKCGKQGHVKTECPQLKKERAYQATWSCIEDESDDSSDEQHDNKALMAITDELTDDLIPFTTNHVLVTDYFTDSESEPESDLIDSTISDIQLELIKVCYQTDIVENSWILDSGCSHHMT
ncbi:hypothetical protein LINPERPRIM_LOCUS684, partial [Linum perenne]